MKRQSRKTRWIVIGVLIMGVGMCILFVWHQKKIRRGDDTEEWTEESLEDETENCFEGWTKEAEEERPEEIRITESTQGETEKSAEPKESTEALGEGIQSGEPGAEQELPEEEPDIGERWNEEPMTGKKEAESGNEETGKGEPDSPMPVQEPEAGFEIRGENERIRETFLAVETDFRSLAEYHAGKIHSSALGAVTFQEQLKETEEELSWRISLEYADQETHEMIATYHFDPAYTMLEEPKSYEARWQERMEKNAYLDSLKPEVTVSRMDDWERLKESFLVDEGAFLRETGEYLYRTFGQVKVSEIRIEYLLKEEESSENWRITLVGPDGDETPVSCTYYKVMSFYSFVLVTEY